MRVNFSPKTDTGGASAHDTRARSASRLAFIERQRPPTPVNSSAEIGTSEDPAPDHRPPEARPSTSDRRHAAVAEMLGVGILLK